MNTINETGILCPDCNNSDTHVIDSRNTTEGKRRRRVCKTCGNRFSTVEKVVELKRGLPKIAKPKILIPKKRLAKKVIRIKKAGIIKDVLYKCRCGQTYRNKTECPKCNSRKREVIK